MGKTKSQRFSKGKSKKDTWKKLKHTDLDQFLQEQREDERLGISEKTNDQLFVLDYEGSDALSKAANYQRRETRQQRKTTSAAAQPLVDFDSLRCFQILKSDSAVKDPVIKRNRTRLPGSKKSVDMKLKDEIRRYKKEQVKIQEADSTSKDGPLDPWSTPNAKSIDSVVNNEWLDGETKRNLLRNRSGHKIKKPTTQLKAVETPHPGLSVNPSFAAHQDILKLAVAETKAAVIKEQKLIRATSVPKLTKGETTDDVDLKEEIDIKSEPESDDEDSKHGIVRPKPKTRQQKRKAKELSEQQRTLLDKKERLKREAEVFRIRSLKKEITKAEKESKQKLQKQIDKKIHHEKYGQLRLSKHKFQPLTPDPLLSDEMGGTFLSDAKNSIADLTMERFKSLQKRNLIEPRVKQSTKRKYKLKRYQRPSEKMEWEVTGMWNGEKLLNPGDFPKTRGRKRV